MFRSASKLLPEIEVQRVLSEIESLVRQDPAPGTQEGARLNLLTQIIEEHEKEELKRYFPEKED